MFKCGTRTARSGGYRADNKRRIDRERDSNFETIRQLVEVDQQIMKLTAKVKDWIRQTILDARKWNYNKISDILAAENKTHQLQPKLRCIKDV